ncbi:MAG: hypothetical protein J0M31_13270 [Candidatus Accumulibacter sp.]|nr:hypothetical protein [Accumulibacter sp.]
MRPSSGVLQQHERVVRLCRLAGDDTDLWRRVAPGRRRAFARDPQVFSSPSRGRAKPGRADRRPGLACPKKAAYHSPVVILQASDRVMNLVTELASETGATVAVVAVARIAAFPSRRRHP